MYSAVVSSSKPNSKIVYKATITSELTLFFKWVPGILKKQNKPPPKLRVGWARKKPGSVSDKIFSPQEKSSVFHSSPCSRVSHQPKPVQWSSVWRQKRGWGAPAGRRHHKVKKKKS